MANSFWGGFGERKPLIIKVRGILDLIEFSGNFEDDRFAGSEHYTNRLTPPRPHHYSHRLTTTSRHHAPPSHASNCTSVSHFSVDFEEFTQIATTTKQISMRFQGDSHHPSPKCHSPSPTPYLHTFDLWSLREPYGMIPLTQEH